MVVLTDIKDVPLFQGFTREELNKLTSCVHEQAYNRGEVLFLEGCPCERIHIIVSGRVKVYRTAANGREQIVRTLNSGDSCACNPGVSPWSCSATAEAVSPCRVWYISKEKYNELVKTNDKLARTLNTLFAQQLQYFCSLIEDVAVTDVRKRLIKFILNMSTSQQEADSLPESAFPITHEEIAQRIGTSRETVTRYLQELKRSDVIRFESKNIIITNRTSLEELLV